MAASIAASGTVLQPGLPTALFQPRIWGGGTPTASLRQQYDVAPDGRLLINVSVEEKVVAARCARVTFARAPSVVRALANLRDETGGVWRFAFTRGGTTFLGATPEMLVARHGMTVESEALAGTLDKSAGPGGDLIARGKDRSEHEFVRQGIVNEHAPLCAKLAVPAVPAVRELRQMFHLSSPMRGPPAAPLPVLELGERLHPTPATGGTPRAVAVESILATEATPRGWYGAPVGWFDATGDGELVVALRSGLVRSRQASVRQSLERDRDRWKMDVIVIDAGHGGKDPGTIGVRGTREKDITLAVALKLGKLIEERLKDVKVIYTCTDDTFVELYRRTQIANESGGKLFVSIHCNTTRRKPSSPNGFEIYLLRPGKTESAIDIAERENAVITLEEGHEERYQELTEENFILVTMQQMAFMKYSETFAEIAARAMSRSLKIKNSGVKQAGFYVPVGASMPNVLVEVGYLSNRSEEGILRSSSGQAKIAEALFDGILEYKNEYEKGIQPSGGSREGR